jgi:hypothetical protein
MLTNLTGSWAQFLDAVSQKTFMMGGYFSELAQPGLRIVGLNTIYWAQFNEEVGDCDNQTSPGSLQFQWLYPVLQNAAANNEAVFVI